ncbi:hypothetical protein B602_0854 [Chlamydia psittaci M56]|nr:hypothetical protein B602_0854 [Chlamydia psittaci M56]
MISQDISIIETALSPLILPPFSSRNKEFVSDKKVIQLMI